MIALRKETLPFADFDNRQLLEAGNVNLLVFSRTDPQDKRNNVLVVANFNVDMQALKIGVLRSHGFFQRSGVKDICSGVRIQAENDAIVILPLSYYWLID